VEATELEKKNFRFGGDEAGLRGKTGNRGRPDKTELLLQFDNIGWAHPT